MHIECALDRHARDFPELIRARLLFVIPEHPLLDEHPRSHRVTALWRPGAPGRPPVRRFRLLPADGSLVRRSRLPLLPIDGFVLCDYDGLDPAGRWCDCPEPLCPHAAYLTALYPTVADARRHARARAERYAHVNLPAHQETVLAKHRLWVRRLRSMEVRGHDYRDGSCRIPDALEQLREGAGTEPAWLEIKRQRANQGADGALLPSARTPNGELFLYASSLEWVELGEIEEELRYPFDG